MVNGGGKQMDYDEVVARLTRDVVGILSSRGASASYSDVYDWLYSKGVHHSDDATALADEYEGK
jgi:hypothetical protein